MIEAGDVPHLRLTTGVAVTDFNIAALLDVVPVEGGSAPAKQCLDVLHGDGNI